MRKNRFVLLLGFIFLAVSMYAQDISSPFSRFGLGNLYGENISAQQRGMGGISMGIDDPFIINPANPASYGTFGTQSFNFQAAMVADFGSLKTTQNSEPYNYVALNHVVMGFPVTKWWRSSFGAMPYSKIGYDVTNDINVPGYGSMRSERWGQGGLTRVYWGNGFNLTNNLRVGFNIVYVFGNIHYYNIVYSPDSVAVFGTKTEQYLKVGNLMYDWGLQYDIHLKKGRKLTLGAAFTNKAKLPANGYWLSTSLTGGYGSTPDVVKDTLQYVANDKGNLLLPAHYGVGFTFSQAGQWLFGADVEWQNWNQYRIYGQPDSLQQSFTIAIGGEFTPKHTVISHLGKRMTYRFGARYRKSDLSLYGVSINEFAVTGGVRFPFKRTPSNINVGFEVGSRGTVQNSLIRKSFFDFTFGINIVQNWFFKRKYR